MALSYSLFNGDGSTKDFVIGFSYIETSHVKVTVDKQAVGYTVDGVNKVVRLDAAPANGSVVRLYRETPLFKTYSDFKRGNAFGQSNVNNSFLWQLMLSQELSEGRKAQDNVADQDLNMGGFKVINMDKGVADGDAVNVKQLEERIQDINYQAVIPISQPRQVIADGQLEYDSPHIKSALPVSFFVQLDGVTQRPVTDYTTDTIGKLTFKSQPPVGAKLDIRYFEPNTMEDAVKVIGSAFTKTVGSGGDYPSINLAIKDLSSKLPTYIDPKDYTSLVQPVFKIVLLSGFVMREQVVCQGLDLSWLVIEAEDAEVSIDRQYLTVNVSGRYPAFGARDFGVLPLIGAMFVMNESGDGTARDGVFVTNGSAVNVLAYCGVRNSGARGLHVSNNSRCNARASVFKQSKEANFRAANGSWCSVRESDFNDAGTNALQISTGSIVDARAVKAMHAQYSALFAQSSFINCQDSEFDYAQKADVNAGYDGAVHVIQGSVVHASGSTATGSKRQGFVNKDSVLVLYDETPKRVCDASNADAEGLSVVAGITVATEIALDDCGSWGIDSLNSGSLDAENASLNNCGSKVSNTGALRVRSGIANLRSSVGNGAVGRAIFVDRGAVVNLADSEYKGSDTGLSVQGTSTVNGLSLDVSGASTSGVSVGNGSKLGFGNGKANRADDPSGFDINCNSGSTITAHNAVGTINKTANHLDSNGVIYNNDVSRNKGRVTASTGATEITVTHGISYGLDREDISVTPNSDLQSIQYYVSNVTSTTFKILFSSALTQSATFSWVAEKW